MKNHTIFILVIISAALFIGIWREHQATAPIQSAKIFNPLPLSTGTPLQPHKLQEFSLIDMNGKTFNNDSLHNRWNFMFFGYSDCPQVCPATLGSLNQIKQRLGNAANVQFLFISINPEQDTPEKLNAFLQQDIYKSGNFIGLTGKKEHIEALAKSIGIHVAKEQGEALAMAHFEHSGSILLVDPQGKLTAIFTSVEKPHAIVQDFKEIVHRYVNAL